MQKKKINDDYQPIFGLAIIMIAIITILGIYHISFVKPYYSKNQVTAPECCTQPSILDKYEEHCEEFETHEALDIENGYIDFNCCFDFCAEKSTFNGTLYYSGYKACIDFCYYIKDIHYIEDLDDNAAVQIYKMGCYKDINVRLYNKTECVIWELKRYKE